jgi:hypothetical protein
MDYGPDVVPRFDSNFWHDDPDKLLELGEVLFFERLEHLPNLLGEGLDLDEGRDLLRRSSVLRPEQSNGLKDALLGPAGRCSTTPEVTRPIRNREAPVTEPHLS